MSKEMAVVFVEGVHYAVGDDGHADKSQPLRWTPDGYRPAGDGEPTHNETYGSGLVDLEPGSEDA